jgi:hypothetical protein
MGIVVPRALPPVLPGPPLRRLSTMTHSRHRLFVVVDKNITAWRIEFLLDALGYRSSCSAAHPGTLDGELFESPDPAYADVMLLLPDAASAAVWAHEHCPECKLISLSAQFDVPGPLEITHENHNSMPTMPLPFSDMLRRIQVERHLEGAPSHA